LALDPVNPDGLNTYGALLADAGYIKKALPIKQQVQALEPFVPLFQQATARVLVAAGEYDAAIKMMEPFMGAGDFTISVSALVAKGQYREAADAVQTLLQKTNIPADTADAIVRLFRSVPSATPPKTVPRSNPFDYL